MGVSKQFNCIFVHIPKTAGTSIEAALGMHGDLEFIGKKPYTEQTKNFDTFFGAGLQHLTAAKLKKHSRLPLDFDQAYKFTFVRNPWDRVVSALAFKGGIVQAHIANENEYYDREIARIYDEFRRGLLFKQKRFMPQVRYFLDDDGVSMMDFVGRFENLADDWRFVCSKIGCASELDHRMKSNRVSYEALYTAETRDMVAEMYADDLRHLGYRFE